MSFPAARWRCQLIGRGRGPRAGLGASLAAAGAQLSGKNWGGCCGEISYRSLGGAAGPRSALTAARPGRARWAGAGGGPLPSLLPPSPPRQPSPLPPPPCSPLPFIPPLYRPTPVRADRRPLPPPTPPTPITRPPRPRALLRGNPRAGSEEGRTRGWGVWMGRDGSCRERAAGAEGGSQFCPLKTGFGALTSLGLIYKPGRFPHLAYHEGTVRGFKRSACAWPLPGSAVGIYFALIRQSL